MIKRYFVTLLILVIILSGCTNNNEISISNNSISNDIEKYSLEVDEDSISCNEVATDKDIAYKISLDMINSIDKSKVAEIKYFVIINNNTFRMYSSVKNIDLNDEECRLYKGEIGEQELKLIKSEDEKGKLNSVTDLIVNASVKDDITKDRYPLTLNRIEINSITDEFEWYCWN